jgi:Xaa-Pro aminopeptidase
MAGIDVARKRGLGEFIYTSPNHAEGYVGHGIGCHYSEPPELHPGDQTVICESMVLVVEPILTRTGVGGVKIEDLVLVTHSGAERLSSCPIRTWNA